MNQTDEYRIWQEMGLTVSERGLALRDDLYAAELRDTFAYAAARMRLACRDLGRCVLDALAPVLRALGIRPA